MDQKQLKKYMCHNFLPAWIYLMGLGFIGFGVLVGIYSEWSSLRGTIVLLSGLALTGVLIYITAGSFFKMAKLEKRPDFPEVVADFGATTSFAADKIRLGERYVFTKFGVQALEIRNFQSIWPEVVPNKDGKPQISLKAEMLDGEQLSLCILFGEEECQEVNRFLVQIESKYPSIRIGRG